MIPAVLVSRVWSQHCLNISTFDSLLLWLKSWFQCLLCLEFISSLSISFEHLQTVTVCRGCCLGFLQMVLLSLAPAGGTRSSILGFSYLPLLSFVCPPLYFSIKHYHTEPNTLLHYPSLSTTIQQNPALATTVNHYTVCTTFLNPTSFTVLFNMFNYRALPLTVPLYCIFCTGFFGRLLL